LAEEVGQVVGQGEQLQARRVVLEMPARQLRPLRRILALLDPLLLLPAILPPLSQLLTDLRPCAAAPFISDPHRTFYIPVISQDVASGL
jgi:hypothetical protein